jgi:hypothetical protein
MISNCAPVVARGRPALRRSSAIGLGLKPWLPSLQPPFPVVRPLSSRRRGDCVASKICSCHIHRRGTIPTRAVWKDPSCQARSTQRWNQQSRRRPVPCRHRHRSSRSPRQRRRAPSRAHARPAARRGATPFASGPTDATSCNAGIAVSVAPKLPGSIPLPTTPRIIYPGLAIEHVDHPWKIVPASLIVFQLRRMLGMRSASTPIASRIGIPINMFDAMRVVLRKAA